MNDKTEKNQKLLIGNFNSKWKKQQDFSTSISEASENVYLFVSVLWLVFFGVSIYIQYFCDV